MRNIQPNDMFRNAFKIIFNMQIKNISRDNHILMSHIGLLLLLLWWCLWHWQFFFHCHAIKLFILSPFDPLTTKLNWWASCSQHRSFNSINYQAHVGFSPLWGKLFNIAITEEPLWCWKYVKRKFLNRVR